MAEPELVTIDVDLLGRAEARIARDVFARTRFELRVT
jgi:hypothetical protein